MVRTVDGGAECKIVNGLTLNELSSIDELLGASGAAFGAGAMIE
jgi:hypothetical protein